MLAITRRVGLDQLVDALRQGYRSRTDIADYLDVTEEFLDAAIEEYRQKYGICVRVGEDVLMLDPAVGLMSQID